MPIDFSAVRRAFYGPPLASPPDHIPTVEEILAEYERSELEHCLAAGGDPEALGLGEHGSLIGGPGKPLRFLPRKAELLLRIEPMPLAWFDYDAAHEPRRPESRELDSETIQAERKTCLWRLICKHLAGVPHRPTPAELASWIRPPPHSKPRIGPLYNIFEAIRRFECEGLLSYGHFTVYEIARIIHLSRTRSPETIHWLNEYARDPHNGGQGRTPEDCKDSLGLRSETS